MFIVESFDCGLLGGVGEAILLTEFSASCVSFSGVLLLIFFNKLSMSDKAFRGFVMFPLDEFKFIF